MIKCLNRFAGLKFNGLKFNGLMVEVCSKIKHQKNNNELLFRKLLPTSPLGDRGAVPVFFPIGFQPIPLF